MSGVDVDGLRWEVRTPRHRGAAAAAPRLHRAAGTSWGAVTRPRSPARSGVIVVDLPGHGRIGDPGGPEPRDRRADGRRPGRDPPPRSGRARRRRRLLARRPDRAAARRSPTRRRRAASSSRARRPASPTERRAGRPPRRRRRPGRPARARRDRGVRRRVGAPAGLRQPAPRCPPAPRRAAPRGCASRNRPAWARREPARRRPGRHGAARTTASREVRAPTLVIAGALDAAGRARAESVAAGDPRRPPRRRRRRRPHPAPRDARRLPLASPSTSWRRTRRMTAAVDLDPRRRVRGHPLRALRAPGIAQGDDRPARGPQRLPAADGRAS